LSLFMHSEAIQIFSAASDVSLQTEAFVREKNLLPLLQYHALYCQLHAPNTQHFLGVELNSTGKCLLLKQKRKVSCLKERKS